MDASCDFVSSRTNGTLRTGLVVDTATSAEGAVVEMASAAASPSSASSAAFSFFALFFALRRAFRASLLSSSCQRGRHGPFGTEAQPPRTHTTPSAIINSDRRGPKNRGAKGVPVEVQQVLTSAATGAVVSAVDVSVAVAAAVDVSAAAAAAAAAAFSALRRALRSSLRSSLPSAPAAASPFLGFLAFLAFSWHPRTAG